MKSYFILPNPLVAADPKTVTKAEMKAYTDQLIGLGPVFGLNSLEDAMTVANEFDPTKKANELFPILEVEHRAKAKPAKVPYHDANDDVQELDGLEINSSNISLRKTKIVMPNGNPFIALPEIENQKSLTERLRNRLPSMPSMPSVRNRLPEVSRRSALISVGSIATAVAATAALTFLQVPAMLGFVGYSLLAQAGISFGLVAASATALTAVTAGASKLVAKFKASKESKESDADNSIDSELAQRAQSIDNSKSASNDKEASKEVAPAAAAILNSSSAVSNSASSVPSSEAEAEEAPKPRRSPRLASQ